ncbi:MAG: M24 family metallopeptidase [Sphaerochaetaceae bacterium]
MNESYQLHKEKIEQTKVYLKESGIDCYIIRTKEGSDPCMPLLFGLSIVGDALIMITPDTCVAVTSSIDAQDVVESGLFDEVITYRSHDMTSKVRMLLDRFTPEMIALNFSETNHLADGLTVGSYRSLLKMLGQRYENRICSSEKFLQRLRSIKSPQEVSYIQKAIDITLEIYDEVFAQLKKGMSEIEIGNLFVEGMIKRNVVNGITGSLTPPIVMRHNIAHRPPGESRIREGDYLIFDFSVEYMGYNSDIARTCYVLKEGETRASDSMQRAFETICEAVDKAMEVLVPGSTGQEVDHAARQHILDAGYQNIFHAVGHQVGRAVHDGGVILAPPNKKYGSDALGRIEEGMVFAIEPTILYEEGPAIISEDNALVTRDGALFLSKRQKSLFLIH